MDRPPQREPGSPSPGAGGIAVAATPPRIPGHTLHRRIGAGSYGEVWLAQNILGEWRAVKIVRRDKFNEERPYQREFEGLSHYAPISLSHPSLLRVLQVERDDEAGYFYCVMELADDAAQESSGFQVSSFKSEGAEVGAHLVAAPDDSLSPRGTSGERFPRVKSSRVEPLNRPLTRPPGTLSPSEGERDGVRGDSETKGPPLPGPLLPPREERESVRRGSADVRDYDPEVGEAVASFNPETYKPRTLREVLRERGRLPLEECLSIGLELVAALEVLHARGLVHRDVKPSNIVFIRGQAKLADIGLVAKYENTLSLVGADGYMPPLGASTPQADLFALGKVIYEMGTGLDRLQCPRLPNLKNLPARDRKGILELNRVILKACGSMPKSRYKHAADLRDDLLLLREGSSLRLRRQFKMALVALAVLVVCLSVALVFQQTWLRARAQESALKFLRHIYDARVGRQGVRESGWFAKNWAHLEQAAALRWDNELAEQAGAVMAGLDASLIAALPNIGGSSLAFDDQGRLLIGGLHNTPAGTWKSQMPAQITNLAVWGDGPVGFDSTGVALQFLHLPPVEFDLFLPVPPNGLNLPIRLPEDRFVVREILTGHIRQAFSFPETLRPRHVRPPLLAMAADGSRVAAVVMETNEIGHLAVWDVGLGKLLAQREEAVTALAFSPDGAYLARSLRQSQVMINRLSEPEHETTFRTGRGTVHCLAFAPDPLEFNHTEAQPEKRWLLAAGTGSGTVTIHEAATGDVRSTCRGSHYEVLAVAFHPNGTMLASAGRGPPHLWDVDSGRELLSLDSGGYPTDFPRGLAFSRDGRHLAIITEKGFSRPTFAVWEVQSGHGIETLHGLSAQVSRVWWSADGTKLAALGHNWELAAWDVPTGKLLRIFNLQDGRSADNAAAAFSPDGRQLAFASSEAARLYDLESGTVLRSWALPYGLADQLRFLDDADLILLRREQGAGQRFPVTWRARNLLLPGTNSLQPVFEQQDTNWITYNTASAPNGDYFVVVGRRMGTNLNGTYRVIDSRDGRQLLEIPTQTKYDLCYPTLDPSGRFLPCPPDARGRMRVLRLPGGDMVGEVDHKPDADGILQVVGPSGTLFAGKLDRGGCLLFDSSRKERALRLGMDSRMVLGPEFSPDGKRLAWGTEDGTVMVADLDEVRRRLKELQTPR